ncbi:MAG: hypothetical protein IJU40_03700 [Desulfovibrionaceae bacterium]|nr:hypothetical protein [Desulfovibrionaceae bacterium]
MLIPRDIREPMLRASGYLKSNQPILAMQTMALALKACRDHSYLNLQKALAKPIQDFLGELEQSPRVALLLEGCVPEGGSAFPYRAGQEATLAIVLEGLARILQKEDQLVEDQKQNSLRLKRKETLLETGQAYLEQGAKALALAFFIKLIQEFKEDENLWEEAALILKAKDCKEELASFYDQVLELHPKKAQVYTLAINLYLERQAFPQAERLFKQFVQNFGRHPKTLARMAEFYLEWGNLAKAESLAREALSHDSSLSLSSELLKLISSKEHDFS